MVALFAISSGVSLLLGFLTPIACSVAAIGVTSLAVSRQEAMLPTVLVAIMAAAVALLGPGALSIDARLFGRREIIIPPITR